MPCSLEAFLSDQAGHPILGYGQQNQGCVVRSTPTQIQGTYCGGETLGIRVNLRYMYSSAVLKQRQNRLTFIPPR